MPLNESGELRISGDPLLEAEEKRTTAPDSGRSSVSEGSKFELDPELLVDSRLSTVSRPLVALG